MGMARGGESAGVRTLARYKRLILLGQASLPLDVARRIVGPDCAYHLYFRHGSGGQGKRPAKRRRRPMRPR